MRKRVFIFLCVLSCFAGQRPKSSSGQTNTRDLMASIVCGERGLSAEEESLLITYINIHRMYNPREFSSFFCNLITKSKLQAWEIWKLKNEADIFICYVYEYICAGSTKELKGIKTTRREVPSSKSTPQEKVMNTFIDSFIFNFISFSN